MSSPARARARGPWTWRQVARDSGLIFCAAVGVYLISVLLAARLGLWLAAAVSGWAPDSAARPLLGAVALDLSKAPGLLLAALLLANSVAARPWIVALSLVAVTYILEVLVTLVLGQTGWLFVPAGVVACRVVAAALLGLVTALLLKKRRRRAV